MPETLEKLKTQSHGPIQSFLEHLEDLRWVLIKVLSVISIAWMACFYLGPQILLFLQYPLKRSGVEEPSQFLRVFSPVEAFSISFQMALYSGIVLSAPFVIYFIGSYILPALTQKERRYVFPVFCLGSISFIAGVFFCYYLVLPPALKVSRDFTRWLHLNAEFWTVDSYVSFVTKFMLGMGVAFELPLIILTLAHFGILNYAKLARARPYVIVLNFILGAVLTTPEVFTQLIMAIPLTVMYEICIWITWFKERKKRKELSTVNV